ncbi:MAG: DUF4153 domain-containing protein [Hymenobacter sp.]
MAVPVYLLRRPRVAAGRVCARQRDRVASLGVRRPDFRARSFGALGLRREWLMAVAVLGLVNALLLAVNIIDINWLWFGFEPAPGFDLAQFVHEGTYVLILQHFAGDGAGAVVFSAQPELLRPRAAVAARRGHGLGVAKRGAGRIGGPAQLLLRQQPGLAYKRLGVCFFLLLTLFGLGTMLLKIWQRRSIYALVRLNALAAYAVLLVLAAGNWEVWMARYNLERPGFASIDAGFLLDLPGRALPTLLAQREALNQLPQLTGESYRGAAVVSAADAQRRLDAAVATWRQRQHLRRLARLELRRLASRASPALSSLGPNYII